MRIRIRPSGKILGIGSAPVPQPVSTTARHWFGLLWLSTAVVLVVWIGLLGYRELQDLAHFAKQPDAPYTPALLWVDRQGTDLRISWNRSVTSFTRAKAGLLSIKDGDSLPQQLHLDAEQLRTGSVLYSPLSDQVQFRLELRQPDGQNVSESVVALSAVRSPVPSKKTAAEMPVSPADTATVAPNSTPAGTGQLPAEKKPGVPVRTEVFPLNQPRAGQTPAGPMASGGLVPGPVVQQATGMAVCGSVRTAMDSFSLRTGLSGCSRALMGCRTIYP